MAHNWPKEHTVTCNSDYIVTNSINSLLIGSSTCIPHGTHINHIVEPIWSMLQNIKHSEMITCACTCICAVHTCTYKILNVYCTIASIHVQCTCTIRTCTCI